MQRLEPGLDLALERVGRRRQRLMRGEPRLGGARPDAPEQHVGEQAYRERARRAGVALGRSGGSRRIGLDAWNRGHGPCDPAVRAAWIRAEDPARLVTRELEASDRCAA